MLARTMPAPPPESLRQARSRESDRFLQAVQFCVLNTDTDRLGVVVKSADVAEPEQGRGKGQDAGAAAGVDHPEAPVGRRGRLEPHQPLDAKSRRLVVARAECHPGVEPEHRMPAGEAERLPFPHGHPVQAAEGPGLEMPAVAVLPVGVGEAPGGFSKGGAGSAALSCDQRHWPPPSPGRSRQSRRALRRRPRGETIRRSRTRAARARSPRRRPGAISTLDFQSSIALLSRGRRLAHAGDHRRSGASAPPHGPFRRATPGSRPGQSPPGPGPGWGRHRPAPSRGARCIP